MARIRTIKPEFPHSESMGRVSRDSRLTFIQLWTLADDCGRLRGNSRMLASLLYPYDDDAKKLIDGWLEELEREKCIVRYVVDGTSYIQICNWSEHQKIDKPSGSKLPEFTESSRILANAREPPRSGPEKPREASSGDLGSGSGSGSGRDLSISAAARPTPVEFAKFRLTYPARAGSQPWNRALKAINARLAEGHTWPQILDGAQRYAAFIVATGKLNTEYTMQAAAFCGPDKHFLAEWKLPVQSEYRHPEDTGWRPAEAMR